MVRKASAGRGAGTARTRAQPWREVWELARGGGAGFPRRGTRKGLARHGAAGVAVGGLCAVAVAVGRAQLAVAVAAGERIGARSSVSV